MKRSTILIATASAALAFGAGLAVSQPAAPDQLDPKEMKKQAIAMMGAKGQPTENHKLLAPFVGEFDVDTRLSMGPGLPPLEAKSITKSTWVLGNRFVEAHATPAPGEEFPMSSIGYLGFDTRSNKYFWWGIDSTDTYSVFAEGGYDAETRTFTLYGENLEPTLGGMTKFKAVFKVLPSDGYKLAIRFHVPKEMAGAVSPDDMDAEGYATILELTAKKRR